jgi:hypothetical protein
MHTTRRQKLKNTFFALKIDMMKAYDRVESGVIWKGFSKKMGFEQTRIKSVMRCVTSVKYSIKVNGDLTEPFTPSRGTR